MKHLFTFFILIIFSHLAFAQSIKENTYWLSLNNITKINKKWSAHADVQFRSLDQSSKIKNILIRPGLIYHLDANKNVTLGYLWTSTDLNDNFSVEHRVWEQFLLNHKIKSSQFTHRLRLEQRFLDKDEDNFAQRLRYFIRVVQPLKVQSDKFSAGWFIALQNEVMLNVQSKSATNNAVFDQNRLYLAGGYRLSSKVDVEAGYLRQSINGRQFNTSNNVVQFALYTRL